MQYFQYSWTAHDGSKLEWCQIGPSILKCWRSKVTAFINERLDNVWLVILMGVCIARKPDTTKASLSNLWSISSSTIPGNPKQHARDKGSGLKPDQTGTLAPSSSNFLTATLLFEVTANVSGATKK